MITYHTEAGSPVVEIGVAGEVTNNELEGWLDRLRVDLEENGKSRILEVIEDFSGMELAAVWTDIKLGIPLARKVDRVAVVSDRSWIRAITRLGVLFSPAEVRSFEPIEMDEARAWIGA